MIFSGLISGLVLLIAPVIELPGTSAAAVPAKAAPTPTTPKPPVATVVPVRDGLLIGLKVAE